VRLKQGGHNLTAIADPKGSVAEAKEDNNDRTVTARCNED
jgi:subtilase family serine protease